MTTSCERCARPIPTESAVYSGPGQLLCPACIEDAQVVDLDARAAKARRNGQIALGLTIALLILVPGAMFAVGWGNIIGQTLLALGLAFVFGPIVTWKIWVWSRILFRSPIPVRQFAYMMVCGAAAALVGGLLSQLPDASDERRNAAAAAASASQQAAQQAAAVRQQGFDAIQRFGGQYSFDGSIMRVDMRHYEVDDQQMSDLVNHLQAFPQLSRIEFKSAKITDAGIAHLKSLVGLREVRLEGTQVTDAGIEDLQKALPNVKVHRQP